MNPKALLLTLAAACCMALPAFGAEYRITFSNNLARTGHAENARSACHPVKVSVYEQPITTPGGAQSASIHHGELASPLTGSGLNWAQVMSVEKTGRCDSMKVSLTCDWFKSSQTGPIATRDTLNQALPCGSDFTLTTDGNTLRLKKSVPASF